MNVLSKLLRTIATKIMKPPFPETTSKGTMRYGLNLAHFALSVKGVYMAEEEITLQKILYWIADNSDDEAAMSKINKATFPFTARYSRYVEKTNTKPSDGRAHTNPPEDDDLHLDVAL